MELQNKELEELINRYVYDVVRRLPQKTRADIERELRQLIEDMLLDRVGEQEPTKQDLEAVLLQLGKPSGLADKYRDEKRCLIGSAYYDAYCMVLKIVLICVGFGISVAYFVNCVYTSTITYELVPSLLSGLVEGFAWVTVLFVVIERYGKKAVNERLNDWKLSDLPQIPSEKSIIKKSDPIVGIIFSVLFLIVFHAAPQMFGAWSVHHGSLNSFVSVFNLQALQRVLVLIDLCFALGIIKEVLRLIAGRYSLKLSLAITGLNLISLTLACAVFANNAIWNSNFAAQMRASGSFPQQEIADLTRVIDLFPHIIVAIIVFSFLLDTAVVLYKGIQANR